MRAAHRGHGFTLVELGVVLAVIAILMSFTVTRMQGFRENAAFERIAKDMDGLAKVGTMYMERRGLDTGAVNLTTPPADIQTLLPPGFLGTNPLNNNPYFLRVTNPRVVVWTNLDANSQWVTTWNPSIVVTPPLCGGGCTVTLTKRWLPPASMVPLLMEKRFLYRDCCCDGSCVCTFPLPGGAGGWYCP